jgi:uncharacterized protein YjbI with pentapeptide repeats
LRMGSGTIGSPKRPPMPLPPRSGGGHRGSASFRLPHTAQIATLKLGTGVHLRNRGLDHIGYPMADQEHLRILRLGRRKWNAWRKRIETPTPNLALAQLNDADLRGFNLSNADLRRAQLRRAMLIGADLHEAQMNYADLTQAKLMRAKIWLANLSQVVLAGANLRRADLRATSLRRANLRGADFTEANLRLVSMANSDVAGANFNGAHVYGLSAWQLRGTAKSQSNLVIQASDEDAPISVDNLETAHFLFQLLDNPKIATVISTVNSRTVLILGRFTPKRKRILEILQRQLLDNNFVPLLFDFAGPVGRDLTETIGCLAHLTCFVIADLTAAKSIPQELSVIVPYLPSVPIVPIIAAGARPYSMFEHIQRYDWVKPIVEYRSEKHLLSIFRERILRPGFAEAMRLRGKQRTLLPKPATGFVRWPTTVRVEWYGTLR